LKPFLNLIGWVEVEFTICEKCGRAIAIGNEFYFNQKILCEKCFEEEIEKNYEGATLKRRALLVRIRSFPKAKEKAKEKTHPSLSLDVEKLLNLVKI
ncbi:MAG: hypothetical protein ACP5HJ_03740, partial [Candidatus Micrarchaeia archaeon]